MTPAEEIRAAAAHLRATAQACPSWPWRVANSTPDPGIRSENGWEIVHATYGDIGPRALQHIALMDPGVALLVADWLDEAAQDIAEDQAAGYPLGAISARHPGALALARAIGAKFPAPGNNAGRS